MTIQASSLFTSVSPKSYIVKRFKMKFSLLLSVTLIVAAYAAEPKQEENVYVLTNDNFDDFVKENEFVLAEFCKLNLILTEVTQLLLCCRV